MNDVTVPRLSTFLRMLNQQRRARRQALPPLTHTISA